MSPYTPKVQPEMNLKDTLIQSLTKVQKHKLLDQKDIKNIHKYIGILYNEKERY